MPTEDFTRLVTPVGREQGIDGKLFGEAAARVVEALQREEVERMAESDRALKEEWGRITGRIGRRRGVFTSGAGRRGGFPLRICGCLSRRRG